MVKIENKTVEVKGSKIEYKELLKACNEVTPKEGFTVSEMRNRLRIAAAIEAGIIEMEDADFNNLKVLVNAMSWALIDQEIINFVEYINTLK